jgi:hypothetical protein
MSQSANPGCSQTLCLVAALASAAVAGAIAEAQIVVTDFSATGSATATTISGSAPATLNVHQFPWANGGVSNGIGGYAGSPPVQVSTASVQLAASAQLFNGYLQIAIAQNANAQSLSDTSGSASASGSATGRLIFHVNQETVLLQDASRASAFSPSLHVGGSTNQVRSGSCGCDVSLTGPGGTLLSRGLHLSGNQGGIFQRWPVAGTAVRLFPGADYTLQIDCDAATNIGNGYGNSFTISNSYAFSMFPVSASHPTVSGPDAAFDCARTGAVFSVVASGQAPFTYRWQIETSSGTWANLTTGSIALSCGGSATATTPTASQTRVVVTPCPSVTQYRVRCIITNATGSTTSNEATFSSCIADVDDGSGAGARDGGIGIEDLLFYLGVYDAGTLRADVDDGTGTGTPDGGVGIEDLLYYLSRFDAGC